MIENFYLYTFSNTHGAISTEKILKEAGATILPVPRVISASCGISVRIKPENIELARKLMTEKSDLAPGEYSLYYMTRNKETKETSAEKLTE